MSGCVLQLTDTHIVARGERYSGLDTAAYLADAIVAINALQPAPDYVVVTGDLVNSGERTEYEHFATIMRALRLPYVVIPGNHDDRDRLRETLPAAVFCGARGPRIRYAYDAFEVRLVGLDATRARPWMGATVDDATIGWLEASVRDDPDRPTILAVHQPPFRSGLHYLDAFGFVGARRLRRIVEATPGLGRVICGHIHCVKTQRWGHALATSGPSTAPQRVPELFERHLLGMRREVAGFTLHRWDVANGFTTTYYRRDAHGAYAPGYGEVPDSIVTASRSRGTP